MKNRNKYINEWNLCRVVGAILIYLGGFGALLEISDSKHVGSFGGGLTMLCMGCIAVSVARILQIAELDRDGQE